MILRSNSRSNLVLLVSIGLGLVLILGYLFSSHDAFRERLQGVAPSLSKPTSDTQTYEDEASESLGGVVSPPRTDKLHVLLPASNPEVNLCKTLMSASILGYPTPTLIAWNETFDTSYLLGGGSHVAKITKVLEYLEAMPSSQDNELVLMMDAYGAFNLYDNPGNKATHMEADIWFQLRPETFIDRYYSINKAANKRLQKRLGSAVEAEGVQQTIIFGAGKRCAPNQVHTVACYPIPESPLPADLYGPNTDTIMGRNKYTSLRQRYLNSGYIIGPVSDMRKMFRRAQEKVDAIKDQVDWDNGSHGSDFMYHGSDQSIFNSMLGEQEFQREVMRRRHYKSGDTNGKPPPPTYLEGTLIDDPLNPSFTHEPMEHKAGKPDEFGMGLDYFSELGQQTVNAEEDATWIKHTVEPENQIGERHIFACPLRATKKIPKDISSSRQPFELMAETGEAPAESSWDDIMLYTNICMDQIPVMIHHNGDKGAREYAWPNLWLQPHARKLMDQVLTQEQSSNGGAGGAFTEGNYISWPELCPREMDAELFRDV